MKPKRFTPRYTTCQIVKVKERIVKTARKQQILRYKGPIKLSTDFSAENFKARMDGHDILKVLNVKNLQPKTFYLARLTFGNNRRHLKKRKLREIKRVHKY